MINPVTITAQRLAAMAMIGPLAEVGADLDERTGELVGDALEVKDRLSPESLGPCPIPSDEQAGLRFGGSARSWPSSPPRGRRIRPPNLQQFPRPQTGDEQQGRCRPQRPSPKRPGE